jgi:diketogulonate reductase-like aldo/keto reductase
LRALRLPIQISKSFFVIFKLVNEKKDKRFFFFVYFLRHGIPHLLDDATLVNIGLRHNKTVAQICLRWIYQRECGSIPKPKNLVQIMEFASVSVS